jgi:hypothetical protein
MFIKGRQAICSAFIGVPRSGIRLFIRTWVTRFAFFLFEIDNTASVEDSFLWVIVGDIPSMYLDIYGPATTKEVLRRYIELAEDWVFNVKNGLPTDECFPFNVTPTTELAELLEKKISFMGSTFIKNMQDVHLHITS